MATIATLNVLLRANTGQFDRQMKKSGQSIFTLKGAVVGLTKTLGALAAGLTAVAAIRAATVAFASFESQILRVKALTGATAAEFEKLNRAARKFGETTSFTAGEAASAEKILAQAGFRMNEITDSLGGVLDLAKIGDIGLEESASILAQAVRAFDLPASSAGAIVDVLAKGANSANTSVLALGEALSFVAPVAKNAGIDIRDAVAGLLTLSDAGQQGERAGTGLRAIILKLASPTAVAAAEMDRLGISTSDWLGNLRPLSDIVRQFDKALAGLGSGEKLAALDRVFEDRGATAFGALLTRGADGIDEFGKSLREADGTASKFIATIDEAVGEKWKSLLSALESLGIEIFQAGSGFIKEMIQALTSLVRILTVTLAALRPVTEAFAKLLSYVSSFGIVNRTLEQASNAGILPNALNEALFPDKSRPKSVLPEVKNEAFNLANVFDKAKGSAGAFLKRLGETGPVKRLSDGLKGIGEAITENAKLFAREADAIFESTRTPIERLFATNQKLDQLRTAGFLDADTAERARRQAIMAAVSGTNLSGPAAIRAGSVEAISAQARSGRQAEAVRNVQKILDVQKKALSAIQGLDILRPEAALVEVHF